MSGNLAHSTDRARFSFYIVRRISHALWGNSIVVACECPEVACESIEVACESIEEACEYIEVACESLIIIRKLHN